MKDRFDRTIEYLRVSVTDRCNLRCTYCMPEQGVPPLGHEEILRYDEILRLVRIMTGLGVTRVRLTGGEPLVRKGLPALAADIRAVPGVQFLGLTTNGLLLPQQGEALAAAGVDGVNISLDTLDAARYAAFTRRDDFGRALAGLHAALALPFGSVKVNCVLSPHSTEADWLGVVGLAKTLPVDVRLIEWMPMADEPPAEVVRAPQALERIRQKYGALHPAGKQGGGPARYYTVQGFAGRVGVIHAMSSCFCAECNRVRLTATGDLKLCLFYDEGVALRPLLRGGAPDEDIARAIQRAVLAKPQRHKGRRLASEDDEQPHSLIDRPCGMFRIGG